MELSGGCLGGGATLTGIRRVKQLTDQYVLSWILSAKGQRVVMEVKAKARTAQLGRAQTGSAQIAVEFYITSKGRHEGTTVTFYGSFASEKSAEITVRQLKHTGWSGDIDKLEEMRRNEIRLTVAEDERGYLKVLNIGPLNRELVKRRLDPDAHAHLRTRLLAIGSKPDTEQEEREPGSDG